MVDSRPTFDEYFLEVSRSIASRADCRRRKVGAVLVYNNRILGTGYNGTRNSGDLGCLHGACPRGNLTYDQCPEYSGYSNCTSVHAEVNCIKNTEYFLGRRKLTRLLPSCIMYVTDRPCDDCVACLKDAGLLYVVYPGGVSELSG